MVERRSWWRCTRVRTCWNVEEAGCELGRDWIGGRVVVMVVYDTPVSRPSEMVPTNLQRKDNGYSLEPGILSDVQSCM